MVFEKKNPFSKAAQTKVLSALKLHEIGFFHCVITPRARNSLSSYINARAQPKVRNEVKFEYILNIASMDDLRLFISFHESPNKMSSTYMHIIFNPTRRNQTTYTRKISHHTNKKTHQEKLPSRQHLLSHPRKPFFIALSLKNPSALQIDSTSLTEWRR